jgi:hypothetical protein
VVGAEARARDGHLGAAEAGCATNRQLFFGPCPGRGSLVGDPDFVAILFFYLVKQ